MTTQAAVLDIPSTISNLRVLAALDPAATESDEQRSKQLEACAENINTYLHRTVLDAVEIGRELIVAKKLVVHGGWSPWLTGNFNLTAESARSYMRVAQCFQDKTEGIAGLKLTEAIALASKANAAAREEIIAAAESGTPFSCAEIRERIKKPTRQVPKAAVTMAVDASHVISELSEKKDEAVPSSLGVADFAKAVLRVLELLQAGPEFTPFEAANLVGNGDICPEDMEQSIMFVDEVFEQVRQRVNPERQTIFQ